MRRSRRLLRYVRPYRLAFAASFGAAVIASALDGFMLALLIPFLRLLFGDAAGLGQTSLALERVIAALTGGLLETPDRAAGLRHVVVLMLGTVAVKNLSLYAAGYLGQVVQEGVARDLRTRLFAHVQRLSLAVLQHVRGGQLLARIVADVDQAKAVVSAALVSLLQNVGLVLVYLAMLFSISWRLTLVTLAVVPGIVLALRPVLRRARGRFRAALEDRGELTAVVSESLEGARLVKAHGAEAYERHRFGSALTRYTDRLLRAQRWAVAASPISQTLGAGTIVLLLVAGAWATGQSALRPEVFVAFLVVSLRLLQPLKALSQFPSLAEQSLAAAERLFEVLDRPSDDVDPPGVRAFPGLEREIAFDDVWVAYDAESWALRGIRLTLRRGEVVAVVGPSGAGKSTLADLLPRFVEPTRGRVLADGIPLAQYGRRTLRRHLGIVSQHTVLFNDTVRRNIAYGDQADAGDAAVEAAARAANAHAFIERLPDKYDTVLGERGMRLSGGERQRIAIARALLRDPPLLILDEATSSLDAESERLVQGAIARLLQGRTVLVIAHRLSTVARADRIVVLDAGRIVEAGRHEELVAAGGLYARLHQWEVAGA